MPSGVAAAKYLLVGLLALWCSFAALAAPQKPGFVQVELVAEQTATPGKPVWIGLRMKHDTGWHTYWKNPGDAGLPTTLSFTLPAGFQAGEIEWPHPERIPVKQLASYGYGDDLLLPLLLFVPKSAQGTAVIKARADWLVCKESCIPEGADLELRLLIEATAQVTAGATAATPQQVQFAAARAALPRPVAGARASAVRQADQLSVSLVLPAALQTTGALFIEREDIVEPGPTPVVRVSGGQVNWSTRLTVNGKKLIAPAKLKAVWVPTKPVPNQPAALRLEIALQR